MWYKIFYFMFYLTSFDGIYGRSGKLLNMGGGGENHVYKGCNMAYAKTKC